MPSKSQYINRFAKRFVAPPWASPVMEFRYGLWRGLSALYSESGRQLGEENTRPFIFNAHIAAETSVCKYEGSRFGHEINISALRIAMKHFDEALGIIGAVRAFHLAHIGLDKKLGIWDLFIISRACLALIAYPIRCGTQSSDRNPIISDAPIVSDAMASQYQFISGVFMICREMILTGDTHIIENNILSASDLYTYADENSIFSSPNGMVCAGSKAKIMELLGYLTTGVFRRGGEVEIPSLNNFVNDPEAWYNYALATIQLDCFVDTQEWHQKHDNQDVDAAVKKVTPIFQAICEYCTVELGSIKSPYTEEFEKGAVLRQNHILSILGQPQIARLSKKYINERISG